MRTKESNSPTSSLSPVNKIVASLYKRLGNKASLSSVKQEFSMDQLSLPVVVKHRYMIPTNSAYGRPAVFRRGHPGGFLASSRLPSPSPETYRKSQTFNPLHAGIQYGLLEGKKLSPSF